VRGAEERIKPYLPRALRSAVSFDDGRITSDWDDRTAIRYEDDGSYIDIGICRSKQSLDDVAAARYITEWAFTEDILPYLAGVLNGIYKFNSRKGTVRLKGSGLGPFLDLRMHEYYNDAVDAGISALADQTIRLVAADAAKRLGPHVIERTGNGATIITTTQGTVCMSPDASNQDGSVQVTADTPEHCTVIRIEPGENLPAYVIRDLIGPGEENN
jgi:hypothetical protein